MLKVTTVDKVIRYKLLLRKLRPLVVLIEWTLTLPHQGAEYLLNKTYACIWKQINIHFIGLIF